MTLTALDVSALEIIREKNNFELYAKFRNHFEKCNIILKEEGQI